MFNFSFRTMDPNPLLENPLLENPLLKNPLLENPLLEKVEQNNNKNSDC